MRAESVKASVTSISRIPLILLIVLCAAVLASAAFAEYDDIAYDPALYGPEKPLQEVVEGAALTLVSDQYIPDARVEILKGTRQLKLYSKDLLLKTYRIQLGKRPRGAKTRRGDGKTPVGSYRICGRNKWSHYYMSLQLDYPNKTDITRAVSEKRITAAQAQGLRDALAAGDCPSGRTRLGGEIFIHGQLPRVTREIRRQKRPRSSRKDLQPGDLDPGKLKDWYDWTLGCIGMTNPDIRELFSYLPDGTPVEIRE